MTLSACIKEYVRHRRSLGVQFHGEQVQLSAFIKSVGDIALTTVDADAVRRYIDGKGPVTNAWFSRFHTVAGFLSIRARASVRHERADAAAPT
jgi:hypothetical protein